MTKLKVTSKFKLFLIISIAIIVVGMAIGTVGHFVLNGFFNYGEEFAPYKSVVVRYSSAEYTKDEAKKACDEVLSSSKGTYSASYSEALHGGEIVYKFSANADDEMLNKLADKINEKLNEGNTADMADLNVASVRVGAVKEGGSRALIFASIAVASATAFTFLYYIFRYKLRAALTALFACVHNLGLFVALIAITRIPVGASLIAISALMVFFTMLGCGVFFDKVRRNFKNEAYAKTDRCEVIDVSASESHKINIITVTAVMIIGLTFGVFAAIAAKGITALMIAVVVILGALACCYGTVYVTPSAFAKIDALCEKVKAAQKAKRAENKNKSAVSEKAQA